MLGALNRCLRMFKRKDGKFGGVLLLSRGGVNAFFGYYGTRCSATEELSIRNLGRSEQIGYFIRVNGGTAVAARLLGLSIGLS